MCGHAGVWECVQHARRALEEIWRALPRSETAPDLGTRTDVAFPIARNSTCLMCHTHTSHATNHEQLTNMTPAEDLQHTVTTISRTRRAYRVSLTMKTASSPHNVSSFSRTSKRYSSAEYAWKRCPRTRSLALTLVDTPSVGSACADTFLLAWRSIDSQYYALLAPQIRARARVSREVRACSSHSS